MLRGELTAQLPLQAGLTCEARLAPAFLSSALARGSLADLLAYARIFVYLALARGLAFLNVPVRG